MPTRIFQRELMFALDNVQLSSANPDPTGCSGKNDLRLRRRVCTGRLPSAGFETITDNDLFLTHKVDTKDLRRLSGKMILLPALGAGGSGYKWLVRDPVSVSLRRGKTLGRRTGLLWITQRKEVEPYINFTDAADRVRDRLGLIHYKSRRRLLRLRIRPTMLAGKSVGRPTFADAGSHRRFKAAADKAANRRRQSWGFSADLSLFEGGAKWIDGAPERVVCPLKTEDVESVEIQYLGEVSITRGSAPNDDEAFAQRLSVRHGYAGGVRRRIENLLI